MTEPTSPSANRIATRLREDVVELIELLRGIPNRTPAMERMLHELSRAIDEYDKQR